MTPNTFLTQSNRNGRPWLAVGYVCEHGVRITNCGQHEYASVIEERMVTWWNNLPAQSQDRVTTRDRILSGATL
jgi:hypothetical protein